MTITHCQIKMGSKRRKLRAPRKRVFFGKTALQKTRTVQAPVSKRLARSPPAEWCPPEASSGKNAIIAEGYRFVDIQHVFSSISNAIVCRACHKADFKILEEMKDRRGFCSTLILKCQSCRNRHQFTTSAPIPSSAGGRSFDVNRRAVFAAVSTGSSRQDWLRIAGAFNMPAPPLRNSWDCHIDSINVSLLGVNNFFPDAYNFFCNLVCSGVQ